MERSIPSVFSMVSAGNPIPAAPQVFEPGTGGLNRFPSRGEHVRTCVGRQLR